MLDVSHRISVIIPAYNSAAYLEETCQSVIANQSNAHIIIVDDGSTDATPRLACELRSKYPTVQLVTQENLGVSSARNKGLSLTKTDYVCFLDSDDLLGKDMLDALSTALDNMPSAAAVYGKVSYIDKQGTPISVSTRGTKQHLTAVPQSFLIHSNCVDTPGAMLIRRSAAQNIGGFDTTLIASEDWEFYNRLSKQGSIVFVDCNAIQYRVHTSSAMNTLVINKFIPAIDKVQERAGLTRLQHANARHRRLAGLYLVFTGRADTHSACILLCIKSLIYSIGSFPYYFSPATCLRALLKSGKFAFQAVLEHCRPS